MGQSHLYNKGLWRNGSAVRLQVCFMDPLASGDGTAGWAALAIYFRGSLSRWCKRGTQHQSIGRCRAGLTTSMVALVEGLANLLRFLLLPGQRRESKGQRRC